jgi:transcriptional regulator with XRE-family HTH domain
MRAKTEKRIQAESLRKEQGLSYSDISKVIGVSKSTLSSWLNHIYLSDEQQEQLRRRMVSNRASFAARAWSVNQKRYQKARQLAVQAGIGVFDEIPEHRSVDELSLAMLYLGEGSKSYGRVQIASTQVVILRYFLTTLKQLYTIDETRLRFRLNLVIAAITFENDFIDWWKTELRYPSARFSKTQYDPRSQVKKVTGNYHGVCTLTYCDSYLQRKLVSLANVYINSRIAMEGTR